MKQKIEIDVPDGKVAVWEDGKVVFKDFTLPKNFDELAAYYDAYKTAEEINEYAAKLQKQVLALSQLHALRDCYRRGWKPDWTSDYDKVVIYTESYRLVLCHTKEASRFLAFQDSDTAAKFLNNFRDLIEQAGDLI
ncbi:MAG: hypothetical protein ACI30W_01365 [Muribaculaceae bacterium]